MSLKGSGKVIKVSGSYKTRRWNRDVEIQYFEKTRGGKYFLRKCIEKAKEEDILFHSSTLHKKQLQPWILSGWKISSELCIYTKRLTNNSNNSKNKVPVRRKDFKTIDFKHITELDREIFDPYWRSSYETLFETLQSCRKNYLYTYEENNNILGYCILGITLKSSFVQRLAVHPKSQRKGVGSSLLCSVSKDMGEKNVQTIKLNTQLDNSAAKKLYQQNGFVRETDVLTIMSSG